jgi:hypothetical protein
MKPWHVPTYSGDDELYMRWGDHHYSLGQNQTAADLMKLLLKLGLRLECKRFI